ncbi:MAG: hypothetical protein V4474_02405 [Patescibacteria group bacterium]
MSDLKRLLNIVVDFVVWAFHIFIDLVVSTFTAATNVTHHPSPINIASLFFWGLVLFLFFKVIQITLDILRSWGSIVLVVIAFLLILAVVANPNSHHFVTYRY